MNFVDKTIAGIATFDDFQDAINAWHKSTSAESVEDYLGISKDVYFELLQNPDYLKACSATRLPDRFPME